jgi:hypothetical protein
MLQREGRRKAIRLSAINASSTVIPTKVGMTAFLIQTFNITAY